MAIISRRNFKVELGAADLTLQAKTGQSLLIKDVKIYSAAIVYANFFIERASVGYYRIAGLLGNHLHFHPGRSEHAHNITMGSTAVAAAGEGALLENAGGEELANARISESAADDVILRAMNLTRDSDSEQDTLLGYLFKKGVFKGFPVAEGETFTIDLVTGANDVKMVEYDIYEAGDMLNTMENGSKAESYMYVNYGGTGAVLQATAETVLGTANNPAEYPDFPFGGVVPSGHEIELIGVLASDVAPAGNAAALCTYTDYLKFIKGRKILFDEDHNGLLYYAYFPDDIGGMNMIAEGYAVGGNYTQCDRKQPLMFDPTIVFDEGEELTVAWHVIFAGAGVAITEELQEVGLIMRINKKT